MACQYYDSVRQTLAIGSKKHSRDPLYVMRNQRLVQSGMCLVMEFRGIDDFRERDRGVNTRSRGSFTAFVESVSALSFNRFKRLAVRVFRFPVPPLGTLIEDLLLEIQTNPTVERMYREVLAPDFDGFYIGREIACLLAVSFNALCQRFASDAPLVKETLGGY